MTTQATKDMEVLEYIVKTLVSNDDAVEIDRKDDGKSIYITVKVHKDDMGILIGRKGIMANSVKTILKSIGKVESKSVRVQFLEPEGSTKAPKKERTSERVKREPAPKKKVIGTVKAKKLADELDNELSEFVID